MTTQLSSKDWEILSAYLDGQLTESEQARLARRLQAQPEMQRALEDLRRTRIILRSAPRRRAPRNFTISPQMVPQQRRPWFGLVPSLGFTSAVATVLLVISFTLKLLPGFNAALLASQAPAAAPQVAMSAPAAKSMDQQAETAAPLIIWAPASGMGGAGGGDGSGLGSAGGIGGGPGAELPTPEAPPAAIQAEKNPPTPTPAPAAARDTALPPSQDGGPILGIRPPAEQGQMFITETAPEPVPGPTRQTAPADNFPALPGIQIGLGVLALASAAAALYLRRRN